MSKKVLLAILDGWGLAENPEVCAITKAHTPFVDSCYQKYPHTQLHASGLEVGLPEGQIGNSEVGHMNLGAGRVVYQNLTRLNLAVKNGTLGKEKPIQEAFLHAQKNNKNVHLLGLLSDGGVHSHITHLEALLDEAKDLGLKNVFVHAFTDGRDCDPHRGKVFVKEIQEYLAKTTGKLATVTGRFFAMDRDKRWERVKKAYDALVNGVGVKTQNALEAVENSYQNNVLDEFIEPIILTDENQNPVGNIQEGDVVIFYNFRTDRGRELTEVLSQKDFPEFGMKKLNLYFVTMTNYDRDFENIKIVYDEEIIHETLGEVLEREGKSQIRIAETEKYAHVTFFFSGGREALYNGEDRILINSPDVKTYDLKPEMSAFEVTEKLNDAIDSGKYDVLIVNYANGDMVGHSGVFDAAVKAVEAVDQCIGEVVKHIRAAGGHLLITADHGNCEQMQDYQSGQVHTQHTTELVPFIYIGDKKATVRRGGKLCDVSPTLLDLMGLDKPSQMTGESLLVF